MQQRRRYVSRVISQSCRAPGWRGDSADRLPAARIGNYMDGRCTFLLTVFLAAPQWCAAQGFDGEALSAGDPVTTPKLLVMVDGKVLEGRFTVRPDGYDLTTRAGRRFIGSDQVRFTALDLADAYGRMQETFSDRTPENHMVLARWCLANTLPDEARREVLDALRLDPNRGDAKRMLAMLVRENGNPGNDQSPAAGLKELTWPSRSATDIAPSLQTRSLAGLSRPVAQSFTRHVQPLLMNKCANFGCHGGSGPSTFQLTSAHRGSSPMIAERNLAAVLRQVDFSTPSSSPLLAAVEGTHGNLSTPILRGRSGSQQIEVLRNWVKAAANDIAPDANKDKSSPHAPREEPPVVSRPAGSGEPILSRARQGPGSTSTARSGFGTESATPHGRLLTSADTDDSFMAEAVRSNARDAFDPSVFNRRFHGNTQSTSELNVSRSADAAEHEEFKERPR